MSQLATTEKFVQQTSAKKTITGPVYMSKALNSFFSIEALAKVSFCRFRKPVPKY